MNDVHDVAKIEPVQIYQEDKGSLCGEYNVSCMESTLIIYFSCLHCHVPHAFDTVMNVLTMFIGQYVHICFEESKYMRRREIYMLSETQ